MEKKLDYQDQVLKLLTTDDNVLLYLGNSTGAKINPQEKLSLTENKKITKSTRPITAKISPRKKSDSLFNSTSFNYNSEHKKNWSEKSEKGATTPLLKGNISQKEILDIMEEYKTAYPIREKLKDIYPEKFLDEFNKMRIKQSAEVAKGKLLYPMKIKHIRRGDKYRNNIYNNILPSTYSRPKTSRFSLTKKRMQKSEKNEGMFLNSHNEKINRKEYIKNPLVKKHLETINFFGPYFSYCPPCAIRNLEFYKNMEQNMCVRIIQEIKKKKGIKNPFSITKNESNKINSSSKMIKSYDLNSELKKNVNNLSQNNDNRLDTIL